MILTLKDLLWWWMDTGDFHPNDDDIDDYDFEIMIHTLKSYNEEFKLKNRLK
jgi:hypothetical protein